MIWLITHWKNIAAAALLVLAAWLGWWVNGLRWQHRFDTAQSQQVAALADAAMTAQHQQTEWQTKASQIDHQHTQELQHAQEIIRQLRADVDTGARQLRVHATCTTGVPTATAAAGVDHAGACQLAAPARSAYFALAEGLATQRQQLAACQAFISSIR